MIALRYILGGLLILLGLVRLRIILLLLGSAASLERRDILQEYLMAKALVSGLNPYLNLNQLAELFIGKITFLPHPAPYPPIVAVLSTPLLAFNVNQLIIAWLIFELLCLLSIAAMITILWGGNLVWKRAIIIFFILLCWYPAMVDLLFGQLTILLTTLLLAALLAWRKNRKFLVGLLIGFTVAIKIFTWPLIIYFALKKDWRAFLSSIGSVIGLNVLALIIMGIGPISDYYLRVTMQVSELYYARVRNYSLWSIGYRLFQGSGPPTGDLITVPPLIDLPRLAPLISAGLAIAFLIVGLIWAYRTRENEIGYAIMICVIIAVSPISWDHYYFLAIISLAILLLTLSKRSFPNWPTILFTIVALLLFLFNEFTNEVMFALNGGLAMVAAHGNRVTFASSLVEMLPMLELIILAILLWRMGANHVHLKSSDQTG